MPTAAVREIVRQFGRDDPPTDAALVTRYVQARDAAAFAELLRRHGPLVLGACRRVLTDPHDAEDAFQVVFLVLARKAGAVRPPGMVASWLYGVAVRTANKMRVAAARRWRREMAGTPTTPTAAAAAGGELERAELRAVLDAELGRLPDALRAAVVLCDLAGKTRAEAAAELDCPEGTIAARLHRARKILAARLTRRGVTLPAAGITAVVTPEAVTAAVPPTLTQATLAAAGSFAAGTTPAALSPVIRTLAEQVLRAMNTGKLRPNLILLLAGGLLGGVSWAVSGAGPQPPAGSSEGRRPADAPPPRPSAQTAKADGKLGYVWDVQFRPDGKRYVVTSFDGIRVHDTETDRQVFATPGMAARYSADGKMLFVMADKVRFYDAETGKMVEEFPRPRARPFEWHLVGFSPDGKRYVTFDGASHQLRDTATGFEPVRLDLKVPEPGWPRASTGRALLFAPDGKRVIGMPAESQYGFDGPAVGMWDAATGDLLRVFGKVGDQAPQAVAISPDGKQLAIGYAKTVRLWDAATFKEIKTLGDTPGSGPVTALAFGPDGKTLAVGFRKPIPNGADKAPSVVGHKTEVQWLDLTTGQELRRFDGFEGVDDTRPTTLPVTTLAVSPDGTRLVAATGVFLGISIPDGAQATGEVKVFSLTRSDAPAAPPAPPYAGTWREKTVLIHTPRPVVSVAFAPDGKSFAAGTDALGLVTIWSATDFKKLHSLTDPIAPDGPVAIAYSPDSRYVAVTTANGAILRDVATGNSVRGIEGKNASPITIAFGPGGEVQGLKRYQLAFTDGRSLWAKTWLDGGPIGTAQFGPLAGAPKINGTPPSGVAYSPDGKQLVFIPNHKVDPTWPDGKRDVLKPDAQKDTHWIAQIWGAGSGAPMQFLKHGSDPVTAVAWSPDGKLVVTGGADGDVALWEPDSAKEVRRFKLGGRDGKGVIHALAFAPDGRTLAAAVEWQDGKNAMRVILLDVRTGERVQDLQGFTLPPRAVAFSPDGRMLVVGYGDTTVVDPKQPEDGRRRRGEVRIFVTGIDR